METMNLLIAGFGGQGVLFSGKFIAYLGVIEEREVSWLPSYGPEMRGGTANCSIIISDTPVGSPIVDSPDVLIVMNQPSFHKYQPCVKEGGTIIYDSTLISEAPSRKGIHSFALPATHMAAEAGIEGLSNMILAGKFLKECMGAADDVMEKALMKVIPPKKANMIGANRRAVALGLGGGA